MAIPAKAGGALIRRRLMNTAILSFVFFKTRGCCLGKDAEPCSDKIQYNIINIKNPDDQNLLRCLYAYQRNQQRKQNVYFFRDAP